MNKENNSAKQMIALAYANDYTTRNLDMRVKCNDMLDFIDCINVIGEYNDFNLAIVQKITKEIANTLGSTNLIRYTIGREGSPVIYLEFNGWDTEDKQLEELCKVLKERNEEEYIADEIDICKRKLRLWFD